jgi:hypothetical protein
VLRRVVEQVTALAERSEVAAGIVAGIVVEVGASEHDLGRSHRREREIVRPRYAFTPM